MDLPYFRKYVFDKIVKDYPQCILDDQKSDHANVVLRLPMQEEKDANIFKENISRIMNLNWIVSYSKKKCER